MDRIGMHLYHWALEQLGAVIAVNFKLPPFFLKEES